MSAKRLWIAGGLSLWLVYTAILGALWGRALPTPDTSTYDYIGWATCQGARWYVDAADSNWPGAFFLHSASTWLFGNTLWSYHVFDYFLLLGSCAILFVFLRRNFGLVDALVVVPLYQAMYVSQNTWFSGERDISAAPFMIGAVAAFQRRIEGAGWKSGVLQGLGVACATLIRPTFLILGPILFVADLILRKSTGRAWKRIVVDHALATLTTLLLLGSVALLGLPSGATRGWTETAIRFNLEAHLGSTVSPGRILLDFVVMLFTWWHWLVVLAAVSVYRFWRARPRALVLISTVVVATAISVLAMRKGFGYHWGPCYTVLAVLLAPLLGAAARGVSGLPDGLFPEGFRYRRAAALLVCLFFVVGLGKKMSGRKEEIAWYAGRSSLPKFLSHETFEAGLGMDTVVEVADYVRASVPPERSVLVWGHAVTINYLAGRWTPTRFAGFTLLMESTSAFSLYRSWEKELRDVFAAKPPELVLLLPNEAGGYHYVSEEPGIGYGALVLEQVRQSYRLDRTIGKMECWRLKR